MAGSVKLDVYGPLVAHVTAQAITANYTAQAISIHEIVRAIVQVDWTGYNGTTGKVYVQLSSANNADAYKWSNWGGSDAQATMATATGSALFHIWSGAPGFIRVIVEIGNGTTATLNMTHRLKLG